MRRTYSFARVTRRILRGMRSGFWGGLANASANLAYAPYQRSLARSGLERVKARGPWPGREPELRIGLPASGELHAPKHPALPSFSR